MTRENPYHPESAEGKAWERIQNLPADDEWITLIERGTPLDPNFEEKLEEWLKKKGLKRLEK